MIKLMNGIAIGGRIKLLTIVTIGIASWGCYDGGNRVKCLGDVVMVMKVEILSS